jgi:hypothetical protein
MNIFPRGLEAVLHLRRIVTRTSFIYQHRYWREWKKLTPPLQAYGHNVHPKFLYDLPKTISVPTASSTATIGDGEPNEGKYMCKNCDPALTFEDNKAAVDHFISVHSIKNGVHCKLCNKTLEKKSNRMHYKAVHVYNDGTCRVCQRKY